MTAAAAPAATANTIYARRAHRINAGGGPVEFAPVEGAGPGVFAAEVASEKTRRVLLKQKDDYSLEPIPVEVAAKVDTNWRLALARHHSPKPRLQKIHNEDDIEESGPKNPVAKQARGMDQLLDLVRRKEEQKVREFHGERPSAPKEPDVDPLEKSILPPVKPSAAATEIKSNEPAAKSPAQLPFDIAALSAPVALERISGVESKEALEQILGIEQARKHGPRQNVLNALRSKIAAFDSAV